MEILLSNVSPDSVVAAFVAGLILSLIAGIFTPGSLVRYWRRHGIPVGWLSGISVAWIGLLFYVVETFGALLQGDPLYWRVAGRFTNWLVMSAVHGLTFGLFLRLLDPIRPHHPWALPGRRNGRPSDPT